MGRPKSSTVFIFTLCTLIAAAAPLARAAADATPDAIFKEHGLTRFGSWLVLPAEAELHQRVWTLQQSDEAVRGETSTHRSLLPDVVRRLLNLDQIGQQREALQKIIDGLQSKTDDQSIDDYDNALTQSDVLRSQGIREDEAINGLIEREGQVEEARARYIGGVMDMERMAEGLAATYSQLSQDSGLTAAITQANADAQPPLTLGPSLGFSNDMEFLHNAAKKIVSASVVVQKSNSIGGLHVLPIINGRSTVSMFWDSGCSLTELSSETAASLGVKLTDEDPETESVIANGSKVKGKLVFLDSIQLGPFTLRDVECDVTIDKPGGPVSPDLLGNSFQSHFLSRLDQQSGRLQLTPIDSSVEVGTIAEPVFIFSTPPSASSTPSAKPVNLDIARQATATASSTLEGSDPAGAIDGIVAGAPQAPHAEWASDEPTGSITLTWTQPVSIGAIKLWDRLDKTDHILRGQLVFDDGSIVPFGELPTNGKALGMRFPSRTARSIRIEILSVTPETQHPGFAEISVFK